MKRRPFLLLALLALSGFLPGCVVGPDYVPPAMAVPDNYKEVGAWKTATPQDDALPTAWWQVYQDTQLDHLMVQLNSQNLSIAQAEAQYRQAQASLEQAQAGLFPSLSANAGVTRGVSTPKAKPVSTYTAGLSAAWELDLWGSVRRSVEAGEAKVQASAAQWAAIRLSAQAQLATAYLQWVIVQFQCDALANSANALEEVLTLTTNQYRAGTVSEATVAQAQSQFHNAQALLTDKKLTLAQLEHAIAAALGETPSQLNLTPVKHTPHIPPVPPGIPSQLLERRPDIAAAERNVAAANAQIGIAEAARYPSLTLSAAAGTRGNHFENWLSLPNRVWSLGPQLAFSVFDAGRRKAQVDAAQAAYDATVITYKQTVIAAFQAVEDNLAAQALLAEEAEQQNKALRAAERAEAISLNQYRAGITPYITVLTAQNTRISAQNTLWSLVLRQYASHVALITALGGPTQIEDNRNQTSPMTP